MGSLATAMVGVLGIGMSSPMIGMSSPMPDQTTCTYDGATKTATLYATDWIIGLAVDDGAITYAYIIDDEDEVPSKPCGAATTVNTDTVRVTGPEQQKLPLLLVIDQTDGAFAPGPTPEASGLPEIEFLLESPRHTFLAVAGTSTNEVMRVGTAGMNLNGDDDADVPFGPTIVQAYLGGGRGSDDISAVGGSGTGGSPAVPVELSGDQGADLLVGGGTRDSLIGGGGRDRILGGSGRDSVYAGGGDDVVSGGLGADFISGDGGNDRLRGGPKRDRLDGGAGKDRCIGGPGNERYVEDCER